MIIRLRATEGNGRTLNWSYDGIYRLTNETISDAPSKNNGAVSYGLDPVGNRLSENSSLPGVPSASFTFNPDDEVASETYDQNGNVTSVDGKTFTYDAENHLVSMSGNGTSVTMVYDAFGNRVSKTVNGITTQYLVEYDVNPTGLPQVMEETSGGAVTREYTYGLQRIDENQFLNGAWTPSFYVYDGGGNVRQLTNSSGAITDTWEYDAFGNSFTVSGTTPNNYLYRGEQFDPDLGLYYLRARYYNPLTGRFMSRDPEDGLAQMPITLHKYVYAGSDPVNHVDPRGRDLFEFAIQSNAAIPEAKLVSIYGCAADIMLTATSLVLENSLSGWDLAGVAGIAVGCVTIDVPPASKATSKLARMAIKLVVTGNYGFCGASIAAVAHDLSELVDNPSASKSMSTIVDSFGSLVGCVTTRLGTLMEDE